MQRGVRVVWRCEVFNHADGQQRGERRTVMAGMSSAGRFSMMRRLKLLVAWLVALICLATPARAWVTVNHPDVTMRIGESVSIQPVAIEIWYCPIDDTCAFGRGYINHYGRTITPSLPDGLSIDQDGRITGTPRATMSRTTFTVTSTPLPRQHSYDTGYTESGTFTLEIRKLDERISKYNLPGGWEIYTQLGTSNLLEPIRLTYTVGNQVSINATTSSGRQPTYRSSAPQVCTVSGNVISMVGATISQKCNVYASIPENDNYYGVSEVQVAEFGILQGPQTISFTKPSDQTYAPGDTVRLTASSTSNLYVTLVSQTPSVCTVSDRTLSVLSAGTCTVEAQQWGNDSYYAGAIISHAFNIAKADQPVAFTSSPSSPASVGSTYAVAASGGASGNPVTFVIDAASGNGACSLAGTTVNFTGVGTCIINANQAGNTNYNAAAQVQQSIIIGKAAQTIAFTSSAPASPSPGATYAVSATGGASSLPVTFSIDAASTAGACTVSGSMVSFAAPGTCLINANQAGNTNYLAAPQQQQSITVAKTAQTVAFTSIVPASPVVGGTYTVTANGGASGLAVTFSIDAASASGACTIAGSVVSFTGAGACVVNANQAGNASYLAAAQQQQTMTVGKASQTVAFTSSVPAMPLVGGSTYTVAATGGASGLPVTFSIDAASASGACTIAGSVVSFTGAGACVVNANQAGNASYLAAAEQQQTVTVGKASQTVAFTSSVPAMPLVGGTYTVAATGGASGLPVTFSIDAASASGACTIAGSTVSFTGAGTCLMNANQAGNANYLAAAQQQQSITVGKAAQSISFSKPTDATFGAGPVTLSASANSGLAVSFASTTSGVCTVSGNSATIVGAGTCSITASQAGNANYLAAADQLQSFTVGKAAQIIVFTSTPPPSPVVGGSYTVTATGGASGLLVTFSIDAASAGACTIAGGTISFTGAGACLVNANQAGNANYLAAAQQQQSITVGKAAQVVTFTSTVPAASVVGGTYAVTATGGPSGLPVTFSIDAASAAGACTIAGSTVSFTGAGACLVNANQPGNANYIAAAQVQQSIAVGKAAQSISFSKPSDAIFGAGPVTLSASATSGLAVSFASTTSGVCTVSGNTASMLGAGICSITASQAGNANYHAAADVVQIIAISKATQTITFTSAVPASPKVGGTYSVTATGGASGNAVTFAIDAASTTGACTIAGSTVTFTGAGACIINANQAGNANYLAASQVQQTAVINKSTQTITFTKPADQTLSATPVPLLATSTSSLTVTFASTTPTVCTISGTSATLVGAGTCSITALQAGNGAYLAAETVVQTFAVGRAAQTITFAKPADVLFAPGATVALSAAASSGLTVSFASQTTSVCSVSGATATIAALGTCTISASQVGNANYNAAPTVSQTFNVLGEPKISATATVSPATFSRAGVTLVFTVTLANTGNLSATGLSLSDARLGMLSCASTTLAAGGPVVCTGSTVTTAADLQARSITIAPQLTYSYDAPAPVGATLRSASPGSSAITVTINLTVNVAANVDVSAVQAATKSAIQGMLSQRANVLTSSGPDTARMHDRLSGGTLFGGAAAMPDATAPATGFTSRAGGNSIFERYGISGTPVRGGGVGARDTSMQMSPFERFMRGPNHATGRPEAALAVPSIFQQAGPDHAPTGPRASPLGFAFNGSADDTTGRFQFATSLSKFRAAFEAREQEKRANLDKETTSAMGMSAVTDARNRSRPAMFDIWLEGSSSYFKSERPDGTRNGQAAVVSAGADMLLRPGLLVGVMAQVDWMADTSSTLGQARDGRGWMAGPYVSARLTPNLYFDARAAWGRSTNHIDPTGAFVDTFATTRTLASAKLTGDWSSGAWRFRPSAEVIWFKETQAVYDNAIGIAIASNTFNLGRAVFGPEVGYQLKLADGAMLEPFVAFKGVWDFARTAETTVAGTPIGNDALRGRLEGGLNYRTPAGISLRATGAYDGVGSTGYQAVQGQAKVIVPLQ